MKNTAKAIQRHTEKYYFNTRENIREQLSQLPQGTIKKREIYGHTYYYLQCREGKKVIHKYIGKEIPKELKNSMQKRETLKRELARIQDILMGFLVAKIRSL